MKTAVITGANGFIGKHLIRYLISRGYYVYGVVRDGKKIKSDTSDCKNMQYVKCALHEYERLPSLIERCDLFFHLAWQGVSDKYSKDYATQLDNVKYACEAVAAAHNMHCKKFIFASSIMEFEVAALMQTETDAGPRNVYSACKQAASYLTRITANQLGIEYCSAIISNVFGPEEFSDRFVITTVRNMISNTAMEFSAGTQMYDFIYIDDAADILYRIGEFGQNNKRYYIGSRQIIPLREYIEKIRQVVNPEYPLHFGNGAYVGVSIDYNTAMCFAEDELGDKSITSFEEGIQKTADWLKGAK